MTNEREAKIIESVHTGVCIGGEWRAATTGRSFAVVDPATTEKLTDVADAGSEDARAALDVAADTQASWAAVAPRERSEILRRAYELLNARADDIALLITLEMGKPLAEARGEVTYGAEFFRWFAEEAVRSHGEYRVAPDGASRFLTMKQPVGPSLLITPWNFPLAMGTRKIGAAVAAGCTCILKPAQQTPLTSLLLADVLTEAGLPSGVLSVLPSSDPGAISEPLMADQRLRKVSFTGSTPVGRILLRQAADTVLRSSMELGGNAPFLVFADADVDAAVEGAMVAKMRNGGESCVAANRFFVQEEVAEEFTRKLAERMSAQKVGPGTSDGVTVGPLIDEKQQGKVVELVDDAIGRGASVVTGGGKPDGDGFFFTPTVLRGVTTDARMQSEEVFGPVAPVYEFKSEDEAVAAANNTEFGLVGYVYTNDLKRGLRVSEALETGMVGLNRGLVSNPAAPFGGVKQSGLGREGGFEGIEEYQITKYVGLDV